jgi:fructose-1,6-bisphosphatase I
MSRSQKNNAVFHLTCGLLIYQSTNTFAHTIIIYNQSNSNNLNNITKPSGQQVDENVQGEVQQQLDVLCNTLMLRAFCGASNNAICAVASEEEPLPRSCADVMGYDMFSTAGEYVAVFDPIDGSKNIDSSLPVGTVFGIYKSPEGVKRGDEGYSLDSFLQRGTKMVAAGYCLYS